jgi:hypothetical protein
LLQECCSQRFSLVQLSGWKSQAPKLQHRLGWLTFDMVLCLRQSSPCSSYSDIRLPHLVENMHSPDAPSDSQVGTVVLLLLLLLLLLSPHRTCSCRFQCKDDAIGSNARAKRYAGKPASMCY